MQIQLQGLCKKFEKVRALDQVSLTIDAGNIVCLLGNNGAGKTTLLQCLSSIVVPTSGHIYFDGERFLRGNMPLRTKIGVLPDFPIAFPNHTPLRHIAMVLRVYGRDTAEAEPRVLELLRNFDLLPLIDTPLSQLSRGQLYKAALVALLAAEPELLLFDEPFASGMDPNGILAFKREARAAAARGATILYSTQILDIAENFSDKICVIDRGKVHCYAGMEELAKLADAEGEGSVLEKLFQQMRENAQ